MFSQSTIKKITAGPAAFLAWSAVFALVYTQLPLFTSNQYTYFLHGLTQAGYGYLSNDWLAGTADPTPIFSALVNITYRIFHSEAPAYVYYGLLLGVYFYSLYGIADYLFQVGRTPLRRLVFLTAFLAMHATVFRFALSRIWNGEAAYLFEGGVADQRILGQIFQPSSFGVFLLLSILFFLRGKNGLSILALAVAVWFHSTYLLPAALLTLGYMAAVVWKERSWKSALGLGVFTLLAVSPVLIYDAVFFGPTTAALYNQAEQILAHYRIPEHTQISWWFHWTTIARAGLLAAALWIVRKTRLFPAIFVASVGMLLLTLVEWATGSDALALLFPWRISTILVPLSSTVILSAGLMAVADRLPHPAGTAARAVPAACLAVIGLLMAAGIARFPLDQAAAAADPAVPMMQSIRANPAFYNGLFFIPPRLESFRIETGERVFVDLKSTPYRDTDVVEWYRRLMLANAFYDSGTDRCAQAPNLADNEGVYLFVIPVDEMPVDCGAFSVLYRDANYVVVIINPSLVL
jgi:hypothetical protein